MTIGDTYRWRSSGVVYRLSEIRGERVLLLPANRKTRRPYPAACWTDAHRVERFCSLEEAA